MKWNIRECGWPTFFAEVASITRGRMNYKIICRVPGILSLERVDLLARTITPRADAVGTK